jgi:glycerol-3-phosphate acyltransferase PlsX
MGGDHGLRVSLPAALQSLTLFPDLELVLVGRQQEIENQLAAPAEFSDRLNIIDAPDVVTMSDKPSHALRHKKDSSMRYAINLLQEGKVDAVVSAGNTGALMAMGCYVLKTLDGIDRPAICALVPNEKRHSYLLDLGANVDCSAEHLYQFAIMGSAMATASDGNKNPRIALMNIGEEAIKGNEQVKKAANLLEADKQLNYIGFVEGDDLFSARADVIVCDGFVGNVVLKTCEGTARYITRIFKRAFTENSFTKFIAFLARPVFKKIFHALDPQQYNGASFLGLRGVLVKSHGNSTAESFCTAIGLARTQVKGGMLQSIEQHMSRHIQ